MRIENERLYHSWSHMKSRCYNPNNKKYYRYGARGITVCDEWKNNFQSFLKWSIDNGYSDELSIDRINNDGNYEPSNCRWATNEEQANNKSTNRLITFNGKTQTVSQWSIECGISYKTLSSRINRGWDIAKALTRKENPKHCLIEFEGKRMTMAEWAREYGISYDKLKQRINKLHWNIEKALTTK